MQQPNFELMVGLVIILQKWLRSGQKVGFRVKDLAPSGYNHVLHPISSFRSSASRLSGYNSADDTCTCLLGLGNFSKHSSSLCIVRMACWQGNRWGGESSQQRLNKWWHFQHKSMSLNFKRNCAVDFWFSEQLKKRSQIVWLCFFESFRQQTTFPDSLNMNPR